MTLWTPDGERPINRQPDPEPGPPTPAPSDGNDVALTPEEEQQAREMAAEFAAARAEILAADAADIVANHAMGLYELAAIHLTAPEPRMASARLAVDALSAVVQGLEGRLGQHEDVLNDALHQIRLVFVQRSAGAESGPTHG